MTDNIMLSITVLSYNNGPYIEDCLNSIEEQGLDSYEVLIVDDCSTDNSIEVIRRFIQDRPQYTLIQKESNSGGAVSSQIGIEHSKGKYCSIIDSDDILATGAYQKLIRRIEEDDSDFAAGLPVVYRSGCYFNSVPSQRELNLFSKNRVLEGAEKSRYSNQVYYWNSVFRTDFIKSNNIMMPSGLLIADRVFMFDAIYKARRISVESSIVYYWRQQKNQNKLSITEKDRKYPGIADRCDSYEAQLRVTMDNSETGSDMNLKMWENSYERLFVPITHLLNSEPIDRNLFLSVFERYRLLMCRYSAFFTQLVYGGKISSLFTYYTVCILENKAEELLLLAGYKKDPEQLTRVLSDCKNEAVRHALLRETDDFYVTKVQKEGTKLYMYVEEPVSAFPNLRVDRIIATSICYKLKQFELGYDEVNNRIDITDLPEATYNLYIVFSSGEENYMKPFRRNNRVAVRISYEDDNWCVTSAKKGGNPFSIFRKGIYTFITKGEETLLYVKSDKSDVTKLYFYNTISNRKYILEENGSRLYRLDVGSLDEGRNILFAEHKDGRCTVIDKRQFSNSIMQMKEKAYLFNSNTLEVSIDPNKGEEI